MGAQKLLCIVFAIFMIYLIGLSRGYNNRFVVGGKNGWVVKPYEDYNHWAQRMRFQVNDTLFFQYNKKDDSVLLVTKENYNSCNTKNPLKSFTDGKSEYQFERSGPHYFITGSADHCNKGQKLIIVVLAVRSTKKSPPTTPGSPGPVLSPTSPSPASTPSQSPAQDPTTPASSSSPEHASDTPAQGGKKSFGTVLGSPSVGVVLSVVVGIGVILGSFVGLA